MLHHCFLFKLSLFSKNIPNSFSQNKKTKGTDGILNQIHLHSFEAAITNLKKLLWWNMNIKRLEDSVSIEHFVSSVGLVLYGNHILLE